MVPDKDKDLMFADMDTDGNGTIDVDELGEVRFLQIACNSLPQRTHTAVANARVCVCFALSEQAVLVLLESDRMHFLISSLFNVSVFTLFTCSLCIS